MTGFFVTWFKNFEPKIEFNELGQAATTMPVGQMR
jgi:hypothetical protein